MVGSMGVTKKKNDGTCMEMAGGTEMTTVVCLDSEELTVTTDCILWTATA
jgi:hypothetical protein